MLVREREGSSRMAWFASSFPLRMRDWRICISSSPVTWEPMTKKVAVALLAFRMCMISEVYWEGASSIVRAMVFEEVGRWMRQRTVGKRCWR